MIANLDARCNVNSTFPTICYQTQEDLIDGGKCSPGLFLNNTLTTPSFLAMHGHQFVYSFLQPLCSLYFPPSTFKSISRPLILLNIVTTHTYLLSPKLPHQYISSRVLTSPNYTHGSHTSSNRHWRSTRPKRHDGSCQSMLYCSLL